MPKDDQASPEELASTEVGPATPVARDRIGPYRILQKLGEGGMGEVWLAEQMEPVRRKVALKVIKAGMDTKQVVARFEAERQALALMDHPSVAKVYEAGATPRGRPYFAMEHVQGVPITEHCDRRKLTTKERLSLLIKVCEGVQHAHHKAVIHRDLKPSNVLVSIRDEEAVPKIIDFGVAKATAQKLTDKTMYTELGVMIGTPEYMSPEQAELTGEDIDTRTDVYALGVMLYELLTGALPFESKELREAGLAGIRKKIIEDDPPTPSKRFSTLGDRSTESATRRRTDPTALRRQLKGELDWITMRALEKDRTRRYGSPSELAADIGRYLRDEPVSAGPPSTAYRAKKFVKRHRVGVAAAVTVALVLVAGILGTGTGLLRARRAEAAAQREAEAAARVSSFLADMLGGVNPQQLGTALAANLRDRVARPRGRAAETLAGDVELVRSFEASLADVNLTDAAQQLLDEQILARAAATIETELEAEPLIAARLYHTLGITCLRLGIYEKAAEHAARAIDIRERELGQDHSATIESMSVLASVYRRASRYEDAEALYRDMLEIRRRTHGEDHVETLSIMSVLGDTLRYHGRYAEAETLLRDTLEKMRRVLGDEQIATLMAMNNLALAYRQQRRYDEAVELFSEAVDTMRRVLGEEHGETLNSMVNLGTTLQTVGRYDESETILQTVFDRYRRIHGEEHPRTLDVMNNLALALQGKNRFDQAEELFRVTLETMLQVLGDGHRETLNTSRNLARLYRARGRYGDAERLLRESLESCRRSQPEGGRMLAGILIDLGATLNGMERYDEAEPHLREALRISREVLTAGSWPESTAKSRLGESLRGQKKFEEAETLLIEGYNSMAPPKASEHGKREALQRIVALYEAWGKAEQAAEWRAKLPAE